MKSRLSNYFPQYFLLRLKTRKKQFSKIFGINNRFLSVSTSYPPEFPMRVNIIDLKLHCMLQMPKAPRKGYEKKLRRIFSLSNNFTGNNIQVLCHISTDSLWVRGATLKKGSRKCNLLTKCFRR